MENTKQVGGSSSSSFTLDLFGPKDSASSSSTPTGLFNSVFPPPSTVLGRETGSQRKHDFAKHGTPGNNAEKKNGESNGLSSKEKSSIYQNQTIDHPCHFSSSIYYGGQEVYSPQTWRPTQSHPVFKKDGGEDDQNGSNSNSASRGNWWQGSLYY